MIFKSVFGKNLKQPEARSQAIENAIKQARAAYKVRPIEEAREPVLKLQDLFVEQEIDRLELLYAADSSLTGDEFWLREIVTILLRAPSLKEDETSYLLRLCLLEPTKLELWQRVFRERRNSSNPMGLDQAHEQCALALLPFFPGQYESRWPDHGRESEARALFLLCLNHAVDQVVTLGRDDDPAGELLDAAVRLLPERHDALSALAHRIVRLDDHRPQSLGIVLESLMGNPAEHDLRMWAAGALLGIPGHFEEGLSLLRQLHEAGDRSPTLLQALISALKTLDEISEGDVPLFREYLAANPGDIRAADLLAERHARREDLGQDAIRLYRLAAASSPRRTLYLRLLGRASASRSDWSQVIETFNEVRAAGQETEDIIIPLATAYSEFDRSDADALAVYRHAIELGSRKPEIHALLCRELYRTAPRAPDSIAQFTQSTLACPECSWAQLGLASHCLETGDAGRALDAAVALLERNPQDKEARRIGGRALAADFSRRRMGRLANVAPEALRAVFEEAHAQAPDAGPVALGLARRRVADGVRDSETARLLGEVCRRNPDAHDLRIARADILWEIGQRPNAAELYRELLERCRAAENHELPRGVTAEIRHRALMRFADCIVRPPGPSPADIEFLMEAAAQSDAPAETVLAAARSVIDLEADHPARLPLFQRALLLAPADLKIERAVAEAFAVQGNPKPAIALAVRLLGMGRDDEETVSLLRSIRDLVNPEQLSRGLIARLRASANPERHSPPLLLAVGELIAMAGLLEPEDLPILQRLHESFPRNVRVLRRLAECLTLAGHHEAAAEFYVELIEDNRDDDELILQMAKTSARLGRRSRSDLRVAQRAVHLEPDNPELILHLAAIELDTGQFPDAIRRLDTILRQDPDLHPRIMNLLERYKRLSTEQGELGLLFARLHIRAGRADQAMAVLGRLQQNYQKYLGELLSCYTEIIAIGLTTPRPYVERAVLYRLSGCVDEAVEDMAAAHRLAPDNMDILGEYADTLRQKLHTQDHVDASTAVRCGELFMEAGDDEGAFEMADLALGANPHDQAALHLLARLQLNAGSLHNCWDTLKKLPARESAMGMLQELARAFAEQEEHGLAVDVTTEAIQIAGPQTDLLQQLRTLYQEQARSSEGAHQRQRILGALSERAQDRYELREQLGSGSMGIVYKAYDRELDEIVVLKIMPEHFARDSEALARFRNEAKAARKLAHPNICRIHDIGEESGRKHISMEYVAGGDLRQYLRDRGGKLPQKEAIAIAREVALALAHAHEEGVLHRDIKAANIMLTGSGRVKLSDFGIASLLQAANRSVGASDASTSVIGTPLYMSPEQFDGEYLTKASDLYSFGVLLYEMLSGSPPFTRGSIAYHHRFTPPPPIPNVPASLWAVIEKLLSKKAAQRYQSAEEVIAALDEFR